MEHFKSEIESLKDLGFEYPLRAYLDFNKFQIFDNVNRQVYPPKPSGSLAWKEKERKFIEYVVNLLNNAVLTKDVVQKIADDTIVKEKPVPTVARRGRPPKVRND